MDRIIDYHSRTKHHPQRYARGPAGLDWSSQPSPFRRFNGAPEVRLPFTAGDEGGDAGVLFGHGARPPQPFSLATVGWFLALSLGLSARKVIPGSSWFLRMNPSSGNLHPTEAYAVLPAWKGLPGGAGVYHYAPFEHALEQRACWPVEVGARWDGFWVGFASIVWREAWKYGERAFRYCQHDVGHALGALRFAAAVLGWRVQWVSEFGDQAMARLLGLDRLQDFEGAEPETPEAMVWVSPEGTSPGALPAPEETRLDWFGRANRLSASRVEWIAIDEAVQASGRTGIRPRSPGRPQPPRWPAPVPPATQQSPGQIIRQRRSAVDFDGVTSLSRAKFLAILDTTLPRADAPPFDLWPQPPRVHLVLFVHRVTGLEPGLYFWLRDPGDADALRGALSNGFEWLALPDPDQPRPLWRLAPGDWRDFAAGASCGQAIAADSAFSLGMLARFESTLREEGAGAYRELFWEAGLIGQALYLAAEAAGVRGTGIGCYFDDVVHDRLGLVGQEWQSLYHFTVGGPVEDRRLRTRPPYAHQG